jgi:hypothetical protein
MRERPPYSARTERTLVSSLGRAPARFSAVLCHDIHGVRTPKPACSLTLTGQDVRAV